MSLLDSNKRKFDPPLGEGSPLKKQAIPTNYPALAAAWIANAHPNTPFALHWSAPTVRYALGDQELSCVAVLLQGLSSSTCPVDLRQQGTKIRPDPTSNPAGSLLDVGMAKFAGLDTTSCFMTVQTQASVARANEEMVANRLNIVRVNSLRSRVQLDLFSINSLGPRPDDVDLTRATSNQKQEGYHSVHRLYMMAAYALAKSASRQTGPYTYANGKYIGAILATTDGTVRAWGLNSNSSNHTYHAEVNTIQSFIKQGNDPGDGRNYVLYTTLKPCCMCAGMIKQLFNNNIIIYYGQNDTGGHVNNATLGQQQKALSSNGNQLGLKPIRFGLDTTKVSLRSQVSLNNRPFVATLEDNSIKVTDMCNLINFCYANKPATNTGYLLAFLHKSTATYLMDSAISAFKKKYEKYNASQEKQQNTRVMSVLNHLYPFLVARGVQALAT